MIAGATQTYSHCGYRDQNPRSDFVLDAGMHAKCEGDILKSTVVPREEQDGVSREECLERHVEECCDWGMVMLLKCL